ncbi:MAG: dual CXXC motif small (seleno)protein [Hyphomicrobiales bacterium]
MSLRCRSCGARYPLAEYRENLDESLDEQLADARCDRL